MFALIQVDVIVSGVDGAILGGGACKWISGQRLLTSLTISAGETVPNSLSDS